MPREGRLRAALPQVQPPFVAPQKGGPTVAEVASNSTLEPVAATFVERAATALVLLVASAKAPLLVVRVDPAPVLCAIASTSAVPRPPATSSVSAELNSRIIMSLSRSSNVPVSYLIFRLLD